jgi:hypothetical protein
LRTFEKAFEPWTLLGRHQPFVERLRLSLRRDAGSVDRISGWRDPKSAVVHHRVPPGVRGPDDRLTPYVWRDTLSAASERKVDSGVHEASHFSHGRMSARRGRAFGLAGEGNRPRRHRQRPERGDVSGRDRPRRVFGRPHRPRKLGDRLARRPWMTGVTRASRRAAARRGQLPAWSKRDARHAAASLRNTVMRRARRRTSQPRKL